MTRTCTHALTRLDDAAPDGLRYWLEHNSPQRSWLDAPRPEWLIYLLERFGYGSAVVERAKREIGFAQNTAHAVRAAGGERPTPCVDACASINRVVFVDRN